MWGSRKKAGAPGLLGLSNEEMKVILRTHHLPTTGRRADLGQRLLDHNLVPGFHSETSVGTPSFVPHPGGHCLAHHIADLSSEETDEALMELRGQGSDLRWGDLIIFDSEAGYRNEGIMIFNGTEIVSLDYDGPDDYGTVPAEFEVITNGVPISYWRATAAIEGVSHNSYVWFNLEPVRDQCLNNIKTDLVEHGMRFIWTHFDFGGQTYRILASVETFYRADEITRREREGPREAFRNFLQESGVLSFGADLDGIGDSDIPEIDNTLYVVDDIFSN